MQWIWEMACIKTELENSLIWQYPERRSKFSFSGKSALCPGNVYRALKNLDKLVILILSKIPVLTVSMVRS